MLATFLGALLIFLLRIGDVSIGTLRVLIMVRGNRLAAAALGLLESGIWILAIRQVFQDLDKPLYMVGYAFGFATGTAVGITIEKWIASGSILVRVISRDRSLELRDELRSGGFGVTAVRGEGRQGEVMILFVFAPRRRGEQVLDYVRRIDPDAFVTLEPTSHAMGGFVSQVTPPNGMKK